MDDEATTLQRVQIADGVSVLVEVQDVQVEAEGIPVPPDIARTIEEVGRALMSAATALAPDKFSVEFGIEAGGEAGIPFVTKGTAKAAFKVALEWSHEPSTAPIA